MQIQFYHLLHTPLPHALIKLMDKALAVPSRVVIKVSDEKDARRLSDAFHTHDPAHFLPHGTASDGHASAQPIYITWREENPNGAEILVITDGTSPENLDAFSRLFDMFDGRDPEQLAAARTRWSNYKSADHTLQYIKQQDSGGWKIEG